MSDYQILYASSNPPLAKLFKMVFLREGFNTYIVNSRDKAISALQAIPVKVLVIEHYIEHIWAVDLCREVRNLGYDKLYILIITTRGDVQTRLEANEAGVNHFRMMPFHPMKIFEDGLLDALES